MITSGITIEAQALCLKMKVTARHAAASRERGESIWLKAERNGVTGFGEGCPRIYSAGDDLKSSLAWIKEITSKGIAKISSLQDLNSWVSQNHSLIDKYPSAWCAIEMALLDLFAREAGISCEKLLGLENQKRFGEYTAVLGDNTMWHFISQADQYLVKGFRNFKVKISGDLEKDLKRVERLQELADQQGIPKISIRLDANNFWNGRIERAISYLKHFKSPVYAIEEPVGPKDAVGINQIIENTGLPVILDESLTQLEDLTRYVNDPSSLVANIKVSRVGGILRALQMIEEIKKCGWKIIIGCHVGETSLLTRAALIVAAAAGDYLIGQEGAFGDYLVEREPVKPTLKFGRKARLNLDEPYFYRTTKEINLVPVANWNKGFGMECRMPQKEFVSDHQIATIEMADSYKINCRSWGKKEGAEVLLFLHGGMTHSLWIFPLAEQLIKTYPSVTVVATDRRGCGLNDKRGNLATVDLEIDDALKQIEELKTRFNKVHLAGWCQGCNYASIAADKARSRLSSLILLTPGFFWNDRFRSANSMGEQVLLNTLKTFKLKPDRDKFYLPVPMRSEDFTWDETWLDFIESDKLKTTEMNLNGQNIMNEVQELSWHSILKVDIPTLAVLASQDRIIDNQKFKQILGYKFTSESTNKLAEVNAGHALHFEKATEVSELISGFLQNL